MKKSLTLVTLMLMCSGAFAQRMYIDDNNQVPLRTGQGIQYRIIHSGLNAGTPVEVLEQDKESGYTLIREPGGKQGWVPTRYLTAEPIARDQLKKVQQELERLKAESARYGDTNKALSQQTKQLEAQNAALTKTNEQLQDELMRIKRISENAINLDRRNRELQEENQQLKSEVELLTADNMRLKSNADTEKMLTGAGLVGIGILIALILPLLKPKKKSSWA